MMSKTCILWLDAVAIKHITKQATPFLWELFREKNFTVAQQKSSFGYASIPASLLTGKSINSHQQFTVYRSKLDSDRISFWQKTAQFLPSTIANYWFNFGRYLTGDDFFLPPLSEQAANQVVPAQQKSYPHPKALAVQTVFDFWRKMEQSFLYYNWPLVVTDKSASLTFLTKPNDQHRTLTFISLWKQYQPQHSFFHLWDLDTVGHDKGVASKDFEQVLKKYDQLAKQVLSLFDLEKDSIVIFSDHGMIPVTKKLTPQQVIPRNFQGNWFADSTILKLWPKQQLSAVAGKKWQKQIAGQLKNSNFGKILSNKDLQQLQMDKVADSYGKLLFVLKPGYAFVPTSFASEHEPKAMHGYLDTQISNQDRPLVAFNTKIPNKVVATEDILKLAKIW